MPRTDSNRKQHVPVFGIVLICLGALLLLQNFDVIPWRLWITIWRFWPVILIVAGVNTIASRISAVLSAVLILAILGATLGVAVWQYD